MKLDQSYGLKIAELREGEMIEDGPAKEYPALLLGNMGVEKRFRKKGLGSFICDICVGLARTLSKRVGCRYVILRTIRCKIEFYQKCEFVASKKISDNGRLWMYRRIIARHVVRPVVDNVHVGDSVSTTKNPT